MKKKILYVIKIIVLSFVIWATTSSAVEHIGIKKEINEFIKKGVYQDSISSDSVKYYAIYDENETKDAFYCLNGIRYPGTLGDIMLGMRSPFPNSIFDPFLSFYVGGHAAFCGSEYYDQNLTINDFDCIEATGINEDGSTTSRISNRDYWLDNEYRNEVIGLRVKCDEKTREKAFNYAVSYINDPYNFSFIFNTNKTKYCTDIISKAYQNVGINLNKDGVAVTVMDLMSNNNTYMFYYKFFDNDGITHIYYLTNNIQK